MGDLPFSIRFFMDQDLYDRILRFADFHGLSLSRACRLILECTHFDPPEEIDANEEPDQHDQLQ